MKVVVTELEPREVVCRLRRCGHISSTEDRLDKTAQESGTVGAYQRLLHAVRKLSNKLVCVGLRVFIDRSTFGKGDGPRGRAGST